MVGPYANKAMQYLADPVASLLLGRTGQQFFFLDGASDNQPLLVTTCTNLTSFLTCC